MDRHLASIQLVESIIPIDNADSLEALHVLGWQIVARKGDFRVGEKCVYLEIDSIVPQKPEFAFLEPRHWRIKTIRLRGQISQGICFPMSILGVADPEVGTDVTELMGVTKYEPPVSAPLSGDTKGYFVPGIPKTDETRIQSVPAVIEEFHGKQVYIAEKVDGTSATFALVRTPAAVTTSCSPDGNTITVNTDAKSEFYVCSRNMRKFEDGENVYAQIARKYNIREKLEKLNMDLAIQGEICGPSIQKNLLGLKEHELFVFNVFDITKRTYLNLVNMVKICIDLDLQTVPILKDNINFDFTMDQLIEMAKGKYASGKQHEGIVIRPVIETWSETLRGRLSIKVINNDYLLSEE